jgi:hypothetical protein
MVAGSLQPAAAAPVSAAAEKPVAAAVTPVSSAGSVLAAAADARRQKSCEPERDDDV